MSKYKLLLISGFLMIILLTLSIKNTNNIVLYNYHPTIEISQKFDFKANILKVIDGSKNDVTIDTSEVNFNQIGKYPVTYSFNNIDTTIIIELVDTVIPDLEVKELTIDLVYHKKINYTCFTKRYNSA